MGNSCFGCCKQNNEYETIKDLRKTEEKIWTNQIEQYVGDIGKLPECWKIIVNDLDSETLREFALIVDRFYTGSSSTRKHQWTPLHIAVDSGKA